MPLKSFLQIGYLMFLILNSCSLDPRAGDLSMRVSVADNPSPNSRPLGPLYPNHCCSVILNGVKVNPAAPIQKNGNKGSITVEIPSSFTIGQTLQLDLHCGEASGIPEIGQLENCINVAWFEPFSPTFQSDAFIHDGSDREFKVVVEAR